MMCTSPQTVWRLPVIDDKGGITWDKRKSDDPDHPFKIRCRNCIGCKMTRSAGWAIRCVHEAQMWSHNCWITLTFDDKSLMERDNPYSLCVDEMGRFFKRLRKRCEGMSEILFPERGKKYYKMYNPIRYYYAGEYGTENLRPHYHACIFNFDFPDKRFYKRINGKTHYRSPLLEDLWSFGYSTVCNMSFHTAAYTARYITEKQYGPNAFDRYTLFDSDTGEILGERKPDYNCMSTIHGIGYAWLERNYKDIYPAGYVVHNGRKWAIPEGYDRWLKENDSDLYAHMKAERLLSCLARDDLTYERLAAIDECQVRSCDKLYRNLTKERFDHDKTFIRSA